MTDPLVADLSALVQDLKDASTKARANADNTHIATLDRRQCFGVSQAYEDVADRLTALLIRAATLCPGCGCPKDRCDGYKRDGAIACCPDCTHRAATPAKVCTCRDDSGMSSDCAIHFPASLSVPSEGRREQGDADTPEGAALLKMFEAYQELKRLGWREAIYCPKDGSHFDSIEAGSTGIHDTNYEGEWPKGCWWVFDGDMWLSHPILFKLKP